MFGSWVAVGNAVNGKMADQFSLVKRYLIHFQHMPIDENEYRPESF